VRSIYRLRGKRGQVFKEDVGVGLLVKVEGSKKKHLTNRYCFVKVI
jgi:hypothetical protein